MIAIKVEGIKLNVEEKLSGIYTLRPFSRKKTFPPLPVLLCKKRIYICKDLSKLKLFDCYKQFYIIKNKKFYLSIHPEEKLFKFIQL